MNEAAQDITRDERAGGGRTDGPTWRATHITAATYSRVMVLDRVDDDGDPLCEYADGRRVYIDRDELTPLATPKPVLVDRWAVLGKNGAWDSSWFGREAAEHRAGAIGGSVVGIRVIRGYEPVGEPVEAVSYVRDAAMLIEPGDRIQVYRPVKGGGQ